jgi:signal transduction histidine kinase
MKTPGKLNLRYLEEVNDKIQRGEFSEDEMQILDRVNRKVAGAATLDEVMNFLFDSTSGISQCDRLGLAFIDEDGGRMTLHWMRANYEPVLVGKGYTEDISSSSLRAIVDNSKPRIINDLKRYFAEHPNSLSTGLLVKEGIQSSMTCPLKVEGRNVGVLFKSSRQAGTYDDHHIGIHEAIVERLSQAVEKAYRIERLAAANKAYLEMLGFVSHELKNPLATILLNSEMLKREYTGKLEPKQLEIVDRIIRQGNFLLSLVGEYLDLARIEESELHLKVKPDVLLIDEVIKPAVEALEVAIREREMVVEQEFQAKDIKCNCDRELLRIVMANLIGNAVKYGREKGKIRISTGETNGIISVSVWNQGQGFKEADRINLFRKFSRLASPEFKNIKGTGVGLYTSWRIIKLHQGKISAKSEYGEWAEFSFEISR